MKSLFLTSILSLAIAACVDAPPSAPTSEEAAAAQPDETPARDSTSSAASGLFWYCVEAGPARCLTVPVGGNGAVQCQNACRAEGFATPHCVIRSVDDSPCADF